MKEPITFFVSGDPKGQPRVRATRRGSFAGVYDPGTADRWKACIRADWKALNVPAWSGPVKVRLDFFLPRPKGHFRTGKNASVLRETAPTYHVAKPDADNLAKAALDALTDAGAWGDDSGVAVLKVTKFYGTRTGCEIRISEVEADFKLSSN